MPGALTKQPVAGTARAPAPPRAIWVLGFVSMLMDISSEMVHSLLPVSLLSALSESVAVVGVDEGIEESTALIVKVFSGALSDHFRRRKGLAVFGDALGAMIKPAFELAQDAGMVDPARPFHRIGKGIRSAPCDALVADLVAPTQPRRRLRLAAVARHSGRHRRPAAGHPAHSRVDQ